MKIEDRDVARTSEMDVGRRGVCDRIVGVAAPSTRIGIKGLKTFDVSVRSTRTGSGVVGTGGIGLSSTDAVVGNSSSMMRLRLRLAMSSVRDDHLGTAVNGIRTATLRVDDADLTPRTTVDLSDDVDELAGVGRLVDELDTASSCIGNFAPAL